MSAHARGHVTPPHRRERDAALYRARADVHWQASRNWRALAVQSLTMSEPERSYYLLLADTQADLARANVAAAEKLGVPRG